MTFPDRNISLFDKSYKMKPFVPSSYPMHIDFLDPSQTLSIENAKRLHNMSGQRLLDACKRREL